jgi:geranylgeranyl reductase family protein
MVRCDALIVGGGPAGSTCARVLRRAGWQVLVMDRARFPRDKVCAGWVTPGVFRLLDLEPAEYRATGLTIQDITGFRTSVMGDPAIETRYKRTISYAIRRCEFDAFLLTRSGADVLHETPLESLQHRGGEWVANGAITAPVVIGAGGHFCPVARHLRGDADDAQPVVAKEAEFKVAGGTNVIPDVPELFFCRDLEGYAWCVRKGEYLNIGIGRRDNSDFNAHVRDFMEFLRQSGKAVSAADVRWRGHAYLAAGTGPRPLVADGMLVIGDAAGLAYPESGEGIKPAVESGRLAAETLVAAGGRVTGDALRPYAAELRRRYPAARRAPKRLERAITTIGRALLKSPAFTRHVVINRWFLRQTTGS